MTKSSSKKRPTFGTQMSLLRKKAGLSQEALARKAGLSRNYIGLLECGCRLPSLCTALSLQRALEVRLQDLVPQAVIQEMLSAKPIPEESGAQSKALERLLEELQRCPPEVIRTVSKIVKQTLRLSR